jgi:hypothetical protein
MIKDDGGESKEMAELRGRLLYKMAMEPADKVRRIMRGGTRDEMQVERSAADEDRWHLLNSARP